ncbi:uncharacterized protein LOC111705891 [Eurytemora carolleeae]|uniref:uncharacterized protein LOC111705891 n=1 Tax=Eurytemora carolleeae TaxID=1294199 RepID=UPI000C773F2E|nr:uncharacterized protein LOC111705891 [Eurytemora carolleeae]|eukprot:XP_023334358.1 uncharacterized protein LOC111705891 [Eurytemora affinis]
MKSKMINIKDYDFQDLLDPASNLDDVEFKIVDENSQELGTVRSHKFLLSLLSPVLKKMFMSREKGFIVVEITGPSFISFQTLIQFLYTGDESVITDISSIDDLFDLYCLGDKYELRGSRNLIKEVVSSFKINQENWIHILKGIKKHENTFLFEDLCDILRVKVQGFLGCSSPESYLEYLKESDDTDFCFWVKNRIQKWNRYSSEIQSVEEHRSQFEDIKKQFDDVKKQSEDTKLQLDDTKIQLEDTKLQSEDTKLQLEDTKIQLEDTKLQLEDNKLQLDDTKIQFEDSKAQLENSKAEISELEKKLAKMVKMVEYCKDPCKNCKGPTVCLDGQVVLNTPGHGTMIRAVEDTSFIMKNAKVYVVAGDFGTVDTVHDDCPVVKWNKSGSRYCDYFGLFVYKCK